MRGYNVLHPIGWDAFGLPAENAAIKRGTAPEGVDATRTSTSSAASFKRMGMSFDWSRQLNTCDPEYYQWTQWLFLKLFDRGLAYRKDRAGQLVPDVRRSSRTSRWSAARCERCGTPVVRKDLTQWFFKITDYAQRLLDDMRRAGRLARARAYDAAQLDRPMRGRRGRVHDRTRRGTEVRIFTTRPDTLWGVTFFVFAAEHPLVPKLAELGGSLAEVAAADRAAARPRRSRTTSRRRAKRRRAPRASTP